MKQQYPKNSKIISYLNAPNFINTLNPHIGKCYRLYINKNNEVFQLNNNREAGRIKKIIDDMSSKVSNIFIPKNLSKGLNRLSIISEPLSKIWQKDI